MNQIKGSVDILSSLGRLRRLCLCLCLSVASITMSRQALADDRPEERTNERSQRGPRGFGRFAPGHQMIQKRSIESGFLFLDGEYVEAPYDVEYGSSEMHVNGVNITKCFPAAESSPKRSSRPAGNRHWEGRGRYWGGPRSAFRHVADSLDFDGIVILQIGENPVVMNADLGERFLGFLIDDGRHQSASADELAWVMRASETDQFMEWLKSYEPPAPLRERIERQFAENEATAELNASQHGAVQRLDHWGYPLTVLGMVLVVAAIGHLLTRRPDPENSSITLNPAPEAIRQTNYSLMLVAAMSAMDLVWTILISQAGAMKELNPLGSHLLKDPLQLVIFKVGLTGLAVALIFALRHYRRAQLASWWGCLLFTILTVRWLTLNSLFV